MSDPTTPPVPRPPTTTTEEDLQAAGVRAALEMSTAGQRRINLIWEITQAAIAISVTLTACAVSGVLVLRGDTTGAAFLLLSNAFFVVISTYLTRTNHTKVGGVASPDPHRGE